MRKGKPGRTPTDIAGAPHRESQIRQDERERVLDEFCRWLNCASEFTHKGDGTGYAVIKLRDIIAKIEELREGKGE